MHRGLANTRGLVTQEQNRASFSGERQLELAGLCWRAGTVSQQVAMWASMPIVASDPLGSFEEMVAPDTSGLCLQ